MKRLGSDHPDVATALNNLAGSLQGQVIKLLVSARTLEVFVVAAMYPFRVQSMVSHHTVGYVRHFVEFTYRTILFNVVLVLSR